MEYKSMPKSTERYQRGLRANTHYEGEFVDLLNKEMEELLKSIENNKELKKLYENNSANSKGVRHD